MFNVVSTVNPKGTAMLVVLVRRVPFPPQGPTCSKASHGGLPVAPQHQLGLWESNGFHAAESNKSAFERSFTRGLPFTSMQSKANKHTFTYSKFSISMSVHLKVGYPNIQLLTWTEKYCRVPLKIQWLTRFIYITFSNSNNYGTCGTCTFWVSLQFGYPNPEATRPWCPPRWCFYGRAWSAPGRGGSSYWPDHMPPARCQWCNSPRPHPGPGAQNGSKLTSGWTNKTFPETYGGFLKWGYL